MNKDRFLEMIREHVVAVMPEIDAEVTTVNKNNGIVYHGIRLREGDESISPVVYLDQAYEDFCEGNASVDDIVGHVMDARKKTPHHFPTDSIMDYEEVKEQLRIKLVNASKNQEMLKNMPHLVFGDLAAIFQIELKGPFNGYASTAITYAILNFWEGVDVNILFKDSAKRSRELADMRPIMSVLASLCGPRINDLNVPENESPMYVLTNKDMINGAAQMLFPENLDRIAEQLGTDKVFIIPSSIHECLVVPATELSVDIFEEMIRDVNETEVSDEDYLSDTLYMYDSSCREYSMAQSGKGCFLSAAA